jgi:hypothetical protein
MKPLADCQDVLDRLAFAEHHFGVILPDRPVVIYLGKSKILNGKITEPDECGGSGDSAGGQVLEERFENGAIHAAVATGSRY